jgi:hypothetical protein
VAPRAGIEHDASGDGVRFCFKAPELAEAFQARFEGELLSQTSTKGRAVRLRRGSPQPIPLARLNKRAITSE